MTMGDKPLGVEPGEEGPMLPPSGRNIGGSNVKTVAISLIVTFVILALMTFAGGVSFVTKSDFTANMANVAITLDQAKADLAKAQSVVASAVQGIPGTVATYVNNAVSQATNQWNSQLSAVSDRVTSLTNNLQTMTDRITELDAKHTADVDALNVKITDLTTKVTALEAKVVALETKVADYGTRIKALEDKSVVVVPPTSGVTISASGVSVSITGIASGVPFYVYSASTTTSPNYFTVRVINSSTSYQFINYSLNFAKRLPVTSIVVSTSTLVAFGSVTYTGTCIPAVSGATLIIFTPPVTRMSIASGATIDLQYSLSILTSEWAQWEGSLFNLTVSATP